MIDFALKEPQNTRQALTYRDYFLRPQSLTLNQTVPTITSMAGLAQHEDLQSALLRALGSAQRHADSTYARVLINKAAPNQLEENLSVLDAALRLNDPPLQIAVAAAATKLGSRAHGLVRSLSLLALQEHTESAVHAASALAAIGTPPALSALENIIYTWKDRCRALNLIIAAIGGGLGPAIAPAPRQVEWTSALSMPLVINLGSSTQTALEAITWKPENRITLPLNECLAVSQQMLITTPAGVECDLQLEILNVPTNPVRHVVIFSRPKRAAKLDSAVERQASLDSYIEPLAAAIQSIYSLPRESVIWLDRSESKEVSGSHIERSQELHMIPLSYDNAGSIYVCAAWTRVPSLTQLLNSILQGQLPDSLPQGS
jgi:hypothetical protein